MRICEEGGLQWWLALSSYIFYFLSPLASSTYLLQHRYYKKNLAELLLVIITWFPTTPALMLKL
ncbi:hypothetical protein DRN48_02540 [Thermococci archaeon]|nr:MAG: hypothetical protein DRN48_02540 [Thermococci archaeon]